MRPEETVFACSTVLIYLVDPWVSSHVTELGKALKNYRKIKRTAIGSISTCLYCCQVTISGSALQM